MGEERAYDELRLAQWLSGKAGDVRFTRRDLGRLAGALSVTAGVAAVGAPAAAAPTAPGAPAAPILKPLPPELFTVRGTNAETRWESLAGVGPLVPIDRFFVRNHTRTPVIDAGDWRLQLFGSALRGAPTADAPVRFSLRELKAMPAVTHTAFIECAGNGRGFFSTQQGETVSGTAWQLGAVGVARWRGVRLSTVLRRAGLTADAVDVLPEGLDDEFVSGGVNLGRVRRPLPIGKALDDVLLAWEMNGEPLPPDHGHPVRLVVPSWIGIASVKWLGRIEVSAGPLFSPWNTQLYRLLGPQYPAEGVPVTRQVVKSAFELPWQASLPAGRWRVLTGRSWSGNGRIRRVDVSVDGGRTWRAARLRGTSSPDSWQRWEFPWRPAAGEHTLRARATDVTGATQPATSVFNSQGYLFDAVVAHPVTAA